MLKKIMGAIIIASSFISSSFAVEPTRSSEIAKEKNNPLRLERAEDDERNVLNKYRKTKLSTKSKSKSDPLRLERAEDDERNVLNKFRKTKHSTKNKSKFDPLRKERAEEDEEERNISRKLMR